MNSKADLFLDKYKELEAIVSAEYGLPNSESAMAFLIRMPDCRAIRWELEYCREVRNLLTHNPKVQDRYAVEPSDEMIALLERAIARVRKPLRARNILIPKEKVLCRTIHDLVHPTMIEMNERVYTNIPILKDGKVIGVFSENTLFSYLLENGVVRVDRDMTFQDIAKYLPLDQHRAESFLFIGQDVLVSDIEDIFADAVSKRDRIGLIFVTHSGKPTEKLIGIISAWDMAGIE